MPFNLLLLPLLGGYWLLRRWNRTRFLLARQDIQWLLLWSATAGLGLLVVSALLVSGAFALGRVAPRVAEQALQTWHLFSPFAHSGKAVLALLLGGVLPELLNRMGHWQWNRPDVWAHRATEFYGDEPEALLLRALKHDMPVLVTLRTGKVYVGFVQRNLNPEVERRHLRLLPVVSGYRKAGTLAVTFTTLYEQIREDARQADSPFHGLLDRDFEIVVPLAEVTTMSLFDFDAYEAFNRRASEPTVPAPADA
jgi:hypothetical protein